jgi:hypothetical protein
LFYTFFAVKINQNLISTKKINGIYYSARGQVDPRNRVLGKRMEKPQEQSSLCRVLSYAWNNGIIFEESPEQMLWTVQGRIILIDSYQVKVQRTSSAECIYKLTCLLLYCFLSITHTHTSKRQPLYKIRSKLLTVKPLDCILTAKSLA